MQQRVQPPRFRTAADTEVPAHTVGSTTLADESDRHTQVADTLAPDTGTANTMLAEAGRARECTDAANTMLVEADMMLVLRATVDTDMDTLMRCSGMLTSIAAAAVAGNC